MAVAARPTTAFVPSTFVDSELLADKCDVVPLKSEELHKCAKKSSRSKHPEGKDSTVHPQPECNNNELHSSTGNIHAKSQCAAGNNSCDFLHLSSNGSSFQRRHCDRFSRKTSCCRDKYNLSHNSGISNGSHDMIANRQVHQAAHGGNVSSPVSLSPARNGKVFSAASPTQHYKQQQWTSSEMSLNRILPKFGNWDEIDPDKVEFTLLFDKARNERENPSSSFVSKMGFTERSNIAPIEVDDEDLYKPNYKTHKRHINGFWALFCCSKA